MNEILAHTLAVDWEQVRGWRALSGVVAILLTGAAAAILGDVALTAGVGALFVIVTGSGGDLRSRMLSMAKFTLVGAVLGALAFASADRGWVAALVLGGAAYLGTLAAK